MRKLNHLIENKICYLILKFMKNLRIILFALFSLTVLAETKSDFTYDKKNNSVIPNYLGEIKLLKGKAIALDQNKKQRTLKIKDKIYSQDIVQTKNSSFIKIDMVDKTSITLGKNSSMDFEKFKYRTKTDRSMSIRLLKGKMRSHFKLKAKGSEDLKVHVGTVSMAVRGTKILGNVGTLEDGRQYSSAAVIEGSVKAYDSLYDEMMIINTGDEYFSVSGEKNYKEKFKKKKMSQSDLNYYLAEGIDPERSFRPLLKYAKGYVIRNESLSIEQLMNTRSQKNREKDSNNHNNESNQGEWKKTLKNLNNTLKKNNQTN